MKGDDILPHIPHALKYASAAEGELDPHVFFEVSVDDDDDDGVSSAYFFLILTSTCCSPFLTISVCLTTCDSFAKADRHSTDELGHENRERTELDLGFMLRVAGTSRLWTERSVCAAGTEKNCVSDF